MKAKGVYMIYRIGVSRQLKREDYHRQSLCLPLILDVEEEEKKENEEWRKKLGLKYPPLPLNV